MEIYIHNTRIFRNYAENHHHHDLILANGCMACAYDDQPRVYEPKRGDIVAIYANSLGLIAYGTVTDQVTSISDERVGFHPTKVRKLNNFKWLAYPIHHSEYSTSNTQTLQKVTAGKEDLWELLQDRTLPECDPSLFIIQ